MIMKEHSARVDVLEHWRTRLSSEEFTRRLYFLCASDDEQIRSYMETHFRDECDDFDKNFKGMGFKHWYSFPSMQMKSMMSEGMSRH